MGGADKQVGFCNYLMVGPPSGDSGGSWECRGAETTFLGLSSQSQPVYVSARQFPVFVTLRSIFLVTHNKRPFRDRSRGYVTRNLTLRS